MSCQDLGNRFILIVDDRESFILTSNSSPISCLSLLSRLKYLSICFSGFPPCLKKDDCLPCLHEPCKLSPSNSTISRFSMSTLFEDENEWNSLWLCWRHSISTRGFLSPHGVINTARRHFKWSQAHLIVVFINIHRHYMPKLNATVGITPTT